MRNLCDSLDLEAHTATCIVLTLGKSVWHTGSHPSGRFIMQWYLPARSETIKSQPELALRKHDSLFTYSMTTLSIQPVSPPTTYSPAISRKSTEVKTVCISSMVAGVAVPWMTQPVSASGILKLDHVPSVGGIMPV